MQERKLGRVFLEIFMIAAILVTLSSIALPRAGRIFDSSGEVSEPVGYIAGMELPECISFTRYFGELCGYSCNFIARGMEQSMPGCWRAGLLVALFSIDYVQQLFAGQVPFEVFTEQGR
jgi:hypothetical protein